MMHTFYAAPKGAASFLQSTLDIICKVCYANSAKLT